MKTTLKQIFISAAVGCGLLSCFVTSVNAATITVNAQLGETGCDLAEAIETANDNANIGGCIRVGSGADVIRLSSSIEEINLGPFVLNFSTFFGGTNLPEIRSEMTIEGTRSPPQVIRRPASADNYRHLLVVSEGRLTLRNVALKGGKLDAFNGGALYVFCGAEVVLEDTEISDNEASSGGGVFVNGSCVDTTPAKLTVFRSLFHNNFAKGQPGSSGVGGAIYQQIDNTVTVFDSTISGNTASVGGGLAIGGTPNTSLSLINTTVTQNFASSDGGGIWVFTNDTSGENSINLRNSIISGNFASQDGKEVWVRNLLTLESTSLFNNVMGSAAASFLESTNLIEFLSDNIVATSDSADSTPANQIIGPLQDNGGSTMSHAPAVGSPAINRGVEFEFGGTFPFFFTFPGCRGTSASISSSDPYRVDQRGQPRPIGEQCDIGAIESEFGVSDTCFVVPIKNQKTVVFCL